MGVSIWRRKQKDGRISLSLDVYFSGKRTRESLGLYLCGDRLHDAECERLAAIIRGQRELSLASGKYGLTDPRGSKITLLDFAREMAQGRNPKDHLPKAIKYLERHDAGAVLPAVDAAWMERFAAFLKLEGLGPATVRHYQDATLGVLHRAERDRLIVQAPRGVKRISVPETIRRHLSVDEIRLLRAAPIPGDYGLRLKAAFLLGCVTGLRLSDLKALTWDAVKRDPKGERLELVQKKTGRVVVIPLPKGALDILPDAKVLHDHRASIFGLNKTSETNYLRAWAKSAGVAPFSFHSSRHTAAVLLNEGGGSAFTIQAILGHTNAKQTAHYAKASLSAKREAVENVARLLGGDDGEA